MVAWQRRGKQTDLCSRSETTFDVKNLKQASLQLLVLMLEVPAWSYTATASCQLARGVEADVQVSFGRLLPSEEPLRRHAAGEAMSNLLQLELPAVLWRSSCRPSFVLPSPPWTPSTHVA